MPTAFVGKSTQAICRTGPQHPEFLAGECEKSEKSKIEAPAPPARYQLKGLAD
jgi:hypothetical protein